MQINLHFIEIYQQPVGTKKTLRILCSMIEGDPGKEETVFEKTLETPHIDDKKQMMAEIEAQAKAAVDQYLGQLQEETDVRDGLPTLADKIQQYWNIKT